jgi:hypothetical protein
MAKAYGGAMWKNEESFTPYPHRSNTLFSFEYNIDLTADESQYPDAHDWIRQFERNLSDLFNGHHYQGYPDMDLGDNFGRGYFGIRNFNRLRLVKGEYDPMNGNHLFINT